jgi:glycosyltransferase involved in cell wall biosynthesis
MADEHLAGGDGSENPIDLSLVIPFFDEEPNVIPVLQAMKAALEGAGIRFELIAVDNGSHDATAERIEAMHGEDRRVRPVKIPENRGYGYGIRVGLGEARGPVVGYAWGDGQVAGEDLARIYAALIDSGAHLAKARRVQRHDGLFRAFQSRIYFLFFALLFGWALRDPNGCPKLFRRDALERIDPRSSDWLLDPEIMIQSRRLGLEIVDVPVVFLKREHGRSKVNLLTSIGFITGLLKLRFRGR